MVVGTGRRLGIIGCGAIGTTLVKALVEGVIDAELVALMDMYPERCEGLADRLKSSGKGSPVITSSLNELLRAGPEVVVEAASQEAVKEYGPSILKSGSDLVVMSVGALLDNEVRESLLKAAEEGGSRIYVPTGAIAGLDAVKAARIAGIESVILRTRKPPKALAGKLGREDILRIDKPVTLFRGPASEAVRKFPMNINVAAALTLAAGKEALVEIVADPGVDRNTHEIEVVSRASRIVVRVENVPSPMNPRTSYLAPLSAIELLREIVGGESRLRVGT